MDQIRFDASNTSRAFAEFEILGTILDINVLPGKVRVGVRSNYLRRDKSGNLVDAPAVNHIAVFDRETRRFVKNFASPGQLVLARGRLCGEPVAEQFLLLNAAETPKEG